MPPQPNIHYLGIDPGQSGGLALYHPQTKTLATFKIPKSEESLVFLFDQIKHLGGRIVATIEQQIPRPTVYFDPRTQKLQSSILKSTCILYANYMQLRTALRCFGIPFQAVVPETWQAEMSLGHKRQSRSDNKWKNVLKNKALELFPDHKVTLWNADAILLAEYCYRFHTPSSIHRRHIS